MSYSLLYDNGMLQIFSFFFKLNDYMELFPHIHGYLFIHEITEIYLSYNTMMF